MMKLTVALLLVALAAVALADHDHHHHDHDHHDHHDHRYHNRRSSSSHHDHHHGRYDRHHHHEDHYGKDRRYKRDVEKATTVEPTTEVTEESTTLAAVETLIANSTLATIANATTASVFETTTLKNATSVAPRAADDDEDDDEDADNGNDNDDDDEDDTDNNNDNNDDDEDDDEDDRNAPSVKSIDEPIFGKQNLTCDYSCEFFTLVNADKWSPVNFKYLTSPQCLQISAFCNDGYALAVYPKFNPIPLNKDGQAILSCVQGQWLDMNGRDGSSAMCVPKSRLNIPFQPQALNNAPFTAQSTTPAFDEFASSSSTTPDEFLIESTTTTDFIKH